MAAFLQLRVSAVGGVQQLPFTAALAAGGIAPALRGGAMSIRQRRT